MRFEKLKNVLLTNRNQPMKKIILGLAVMLTVTIQAQVPNYTPANGLVGWFPFTGNSNDLSTIGNNGIVSGASLVNDRLGNTNSAYSFNGSTDYITIPHNAAYNNQQYSISFWFKFSIPSTSGSGGFNVNPSLMSKLAANTNVNYDNWVFYEGQGQIGFGSGQGGASGVGGTPSSGQNDGQWRHIIVSIGSDSIRTYLNGQKISANPKGVNLTFNSQPINIGRSVATYWKAYQGSIDDIGIWNRVLTQQEVTALYNSCANTTATITPNGNTTFCQGGSVVLQSSSGNSYSWSNGATSQSITVTQGNTYTVTVADANNCTATASSVVTVNPNPTVTFTLPTITNVGAAPFTMNGNPSGGSYAGAGVNGNIFNPANAGLGLKQVNYTFTNGNGCSGSVSSTTLVYDSTGVVCTSYDTITTTINDTVTTYLSVNDTLKINVNLTGIAPPNNTNMLAVYPNPTQDHIFIDCGNYASMSGYTVKITNTLGQIVFNQPVNQQQFYIDLSTWRGAGTYIMYIIDQNQTVKSQKQIVLQ